MAAGAEGQVFLKCWHLFHHRLLWEAHSIGPAASPLLSWLHARIAGPGQWLEHPFSLRAPPFLALSRATAKKAKDSSV